MLNIDLDGKLDLEDLEYLLDRLPASRAFLGGFLLSCTYYGWRDTDTGPIYLWSFDSLRHLAANLDPFDDVWFEVVDESRKHILLMTINRLIEQPIADDADGEKLGMDWHKEFLPIPKFRGDKLGYHYTTEEPA